jgi:hypothetical protein
MASAASPDKETKHRPFKAGIDGKQARQRREEVTIELRKNAREEMITKRRYQGQTSQFATVNSTITANENQPAPDEIEKRLKELPQLVAAVNGTDVQKQLEAVTHFRKLLSIERLPPIEEVIATGVVPTLIRFLKNHQYPNLQFEAAWAVTNIASGTSKHTKVVIDYGAIPIFVSLLHAPNEEVREQAVWALGNIAGDSPDFRDDVLKSNAMKPLIDLCTSTAKLTLLRNITWTLANFCRGKPQPDFEAIRPALGVLANLLYYKDDEILADACWALSYISDDNTHHNKKIQAVITTGITKRLVTLLGHESNNVKTPALRTVGNIVTGDDLQTAAILSCNVLPYLLDLLSNTKKGIRKETCWTLSNITAGSQDQIQMCIQANIFPMLIKTLRNAEFDVQKEAAWAISNATSGGSDEQLKYLVEQSVIPPLCNLFSCQDPKIVMVAMEGIENILRVGRKEAETSNTQNRYAEFVEECQGLTDLEKLQGHDSEDIYNKALKILREFFESEDDDEQHAPTVAEGQAEFQFGSGMADGSSAQQPDYGFGK